jgi:hypothetical protein
MGKKTPEEQILKEIEKRIKRGDDINQQIDGSSTPVMSAAAAGYLSVVNFFIQSGADLTLKNKWKEDVLKSAKYSESKEMVALVQGALKGANATEEPATVYYQPKLKKPRPSTHSRRIRSSKQSMIVRNLMWDFSLMMAKYLLLIQPSLSPPKPVPRPYPSMKARLLSRWANGKKRMKKVLNSFSRRAKLNCMA